MDRLDDLKRAFINGLGISEDTHLETLEYRGIKEWNSVAHMQLVMEIENTFGVMLPTEDVIDLSSFRRAIEILGKHGVEVRS